MSRLPIGRPRPRPVPRPTVSPTPGPTPGPSPSSTIVLTTTQFLYNGTEGDDTFIGAINTANQQTLLGNDTLNGLGGEDRLVATLNVAAQTLVPTLNSIESVEITATAAGTLSLLSSTGVNRVVNQSSTAALTFSNAAAGTQLGLQNIVNNDTTFALANASGSSDAVTVVLNNVTSTGPGTAATESELTIAGVETINFIANTAPSSLALTGSSPVAVNIAGSANLALRNGNSGGSLNAVNASSYSGALTYTAGGDNAVAYTGGTGNDNFILGTTFTNADTVNGGTGVDTITTASAQATGYTAVSPQVVTGVERLAITDALATNLTPSNISSQLTTVELQAALTASRTINAPSGEFTVTNGPTNGIADGGVADLTVSAAGSGTTDTLNIVNSATAAADLFDANNGGASGDLNAPGYEIVNFNTGSTTAPGAQQIKAVTITPSPTASSSAFNLTGVNSLTTEGTTGIITATTINASGLTGTAFLSMGAAAAAGLTSILGSANSDTLRGDASSSIVGANGNDSIFGGSGNDTLLGGFGNDQVTTGTGSDSVDGGEGNDTVIVGSSLTSADTLSGGSGVDQIDLVTAAFTAADASGVTNFETLGLFLGSGTVTLTNFISNPGFNTAIVGDNTGAVTLSNASSSLNTLAFAVDSTGGEAVTFSRLIDTATDSLTVQTQGTLGAAQTSLTANDEETITLNSTFNNQNFNTIITSVTAGDLATLNVQGGGSYEVTTLTATSLSTINTTASTGAVTVGAGSSLVNVSVTTGTGAQTITTGSGNDSFTGNVSNDTFVAGAGFDTINGGIGADNLTGGLGADSLTGAAGSDNFIYSAVNQGGNVVSVANAAVLTAGDIITDFVSGADKVDVSAVASGTGAQTVAQGTSGTPINLSATTSAAVVTTSFDFRLGTSTSADVAAAIGNVTTTGANTATFFIFDNQGTASTADDTYNIFQAVTTATLSAALYSGADTISLLGSINSNTFAATDVTNV